MKPAEDGSGLYIIQQFLIMDAPKGAYTMVPGQGKKTRIPSNNISICTVIHTKFLTSNHSVSLAKQALSGTEPMIITP